MSGAQARVGVRVARGALAGLVAGLAASFVMDQFQAAISKLASSGDDRSQPATEQAADSIAEALTGDELAKDTKPLGGQAMHYGLGIGLGIAYGVAAEFRPAVTRGYGSAFGTGIMTLLDEGAVPAAGLGEAPWRADPRTTLYAYASHLVFGGVAEFVRRQVSATLVRS